MIEQHPIPQQITSYEFKLVGDMTLKQFLKAAGGIVLAVLINASGIVFFIKYPLMIILAATGLAMAFVPYQDRPLETWILSFIKGIYAPTIYTYKKSMKLNWLDIDRNKKLPEDEEKEDVNIPIKHQGKVDEFIKSLPSVKREGEWSGYGDNEQLTTPELEEKKLPIVMEETSSQENEKTVARVQVEDNKWRDQKAKLDLKTEKLEATGKAVFGKIPMPDIPDLPNIIVGMVTDQEGKIIDGAIVEIQDEKGNPARVLKSNSLGQFKTSTQLANGRYLIITEKEGKNFDRVNIDLSGSIVQPIKIISLN